MKPYSLTLLLFLAMSSSSLQAQLICDQDAYGNDICDEEPAEAETEFDDAYSSGTVSGIPGVPTHRPMGRGVDASAGTGGPVSPVLTEDLDPDDDNEGVVWEVTEDGLGNYSARSNDGRILFGATDPYGDLAWRDQRGRLVDCAFDQAGRLVCE